MARLVYACRFEIPAAEGMKSVLETYQRWFNSHYRIRRRIEDFLFDPGQSDGAIGLPADHFYPQAPMKRMVTKQYG